MNIVRDLEERKLINNDCMNILPKITEKGIIKIE